MRWKGTGLMPGAVEAWNSYQTRAQRVIIGPLVVALSVFVTGLPGTLIFIAGIALSGVLFWKTISALRVFLRAQRSQGGT